MIDATAPGSGFYHSVKIGLVIAVLTLLSSSLCAPTADPWWYKPCESNLKLRHSRSTSENTVKHQFKIFLDQLKLSKNKIVKLYVNGNISPVKSNKVRWLKIQKMISSVRNAVNIKKFEKFHEVLQHFAGFFEKLRDVKIQTQVFPFNQEERRGIYSNISYQLRTLLCEFHDELERNNASLSKVPRNKIKVKIANTLDLTEGHAIDVNFFSKTISFFKRTQKILRLSKTKNAKKTKVKKTKKSSS